MRTTGAKTPLAIYMFGLRPGPFTLVALLGAGGKPSTWLPPGKLADLLNNCTVHVLSNTLTSFSGVSLRIPNALGDLQMLFNLLSHSMLLPIAAVLLSWTIVRYFP